MNLTIKQQRVLDFIEDFQLNNGKSPTIKEIKTFMGVSSDNSVIKHLNALQKKGFISKSDTPRGIGLLESVSNKLQANFANLPLMGFVPAGGPVHAESYIDDYVSVDTSKIKNPHSCFLLKVTGQSMIDAGIFEDDLLVADASREPKVGDIVIALVDNANTVKRLCKNDGRLYLKAENNEYEDIVPAESLEIQGVVLTLIRNY